VTKAHKVTACQDAFKRSLSVMETYAINGVLNVVVEKYEKNNKITEVLWIITIRNFKFFRGETIVLCYNSAREQLKHWVEKQRYPENIIPR
jgi:hypothetical protein